jgi:hypothetical protein
MKNNILLAIFLLTKISPSNAASQEQLKKYQASIKENTVDLGENFHFAPTPSNDRIPSSVSNTKDDEKFKVRKNNYFGEDEDQEDVYNQDFDPESPNDRGIASDPEQSKDGKVKYWRWDSDQE